MKIKTNISVVVPFYNVGLYIEECILSILNTDLIIELVLVNDGSTDESLDIAKKYADGYPNVVLLNQAHSGPSTARNRGLEVASGEYVSFIDSDDWIAPDSLETLYECAECNAADMVLGQMVYYRDNRTFDILNMPNDIDGVVFDGRDFFITLMQQQIYYPMACAYIYRREWINNCNLLFDEHILHEDEVWTQIALCYAKRVVSCYSHEFYFYRKREGSIMHADNLDERAKSIFYITDRLIRFADKYKFDNTDKALKSWIYVNISRLYAQIFIMLSKYNDSTIVLPDYTHIDYIVKQIEQMTEDAGDMCRKKCAAAMANQAICIEWRNAPWNKQFTNDLRNIDKRIILFYHNSELHTDSLSQWDDLPGNYTVTDDRKYYTQSCAVVFGLHNLLYSLRQDIDKLEHHKWINWTLECEENYPVLKDEQILSLFDIQINYHPNADIIDAFYKNFALNNQPVANLAPKDADICMLTSSFADNTWNWYLDELMQDLEVVHYEGLYDNSGEDLCQMQKERSHILSKYKFVIVFENAIAADYVTDKFYDPLLVGTVPVYLGAPNIDDYVPDVACYVNIRDYSSPRELAAYLNRCLTDDAEYGQYHRWSSQEWQDVFVNKLKVTDKSPIVRLCEYLDREDT